MAKSMSNRLRSGPSGLSKWITLQLCKLVDKAPGGPEWLHEIKYDGYRMHRPPLGEEPMTNAERKALYRAALSPAQPKAARETAPLRARHLKRLADTCDVGISTIRRATRAAWTSIC